jgi:hypothetical protein
VFALGRESEQFREARLVNLAQWAFAVRLNPFGMFLTQCFVDLALEGNESLDFARKSWRSVRFHGESIGKNQRAATTRAWDFEVLLPR